MKRLLTAALLLLLLLAALPVQPAVKAQTAPQANVLSLYTLNRYGYAVVNETVTFSNNQSAPATLPSIQIGLGNLSSLVANTVLNGGNFTMNSPSPGGPFTVSPNNQLPAGGKTSFTVSSLISGEVSLAANGSLRVLGLLRPSLDIPVQSLKQTIVMPALTKYRYTPAGFTWTQTADNNTYVRRFASNVTQGGAVTSAPYLFKTSSADFFPIYVYDATRTITVGLNGSPMVTDTIIMKNLGMSPLSTLPVSPLTTPNARVTVVPPAQPKLLNPVSITLGGDTIDLAGALGSTLQAGSNLTISFQYPLDAKYYTVSGSQVTMTLPNSPPVPSVVLTYEIGISAPSGISVVKGGSQTFTGVSQRTTGTTTAAYSLSMGWAIDAGIPAASLIFLLVFAGLFASRGTTVQEEEAEESSGERVEDMIKSFDEKTSLINGLWAEIEGKDPNELNKAYFDEIRGRLDTFRGRALQRLNEVKQKSTTQKFFDLLNQIHTTEREVDRAVKDKLNLYEQYYMRRMRKEVFDRLLPQYTKRLEKGLNDLSDELHVVQKEAKLL